jgi:hypothetical protein
MSYIVVSGLLGMVGGHVGGGSGDGGVGDIIQMAFIGGPGMGDSSPKVVRFHFSVGCWLGGADTASGT